MINLSNDKELKGRLFVFISGVLWGTIGLFVQIMKFNGSTSYLTSFLRIFFAFIVSAIITISKYGFNSLKIDKKTLFFCAILGFICHGLYNVFFSTAVIRVGVTISAILLNVAPVFTVIILGLFFHEKITRAKVIVLVINIFGCTLAVTGGEFDMSKLSTIGILYGVGAGFCYSMTTIIGRFLGTNINVFVTSTYSYFFAVGFITIFTKPWEMLFVANTSILIVGFFYALIPTVIAYLFYYQGLKYITESSKVPIIASVETVVAGIIGLTVFCEKMNRINLLGILLVMVSIGLMNSKIIVRRNNNRI